MRGVFVCLAFRKKSRQIIAACSDTYHADVNFSNSLIGNYIHRLKGIQEMIGISYEEDGGAHRYRFSLPARRAE